MRSTLAIWSALSLIMASSWVESRSSSKSNSALRVVRSSSFFFASVSRVVVASFFHDARLTFTFSYVLRSSAFWLWSSSFTFRY